MSVERQEIIKGIVTETPGFLLPDNQSYELESYLNHFALQAITGLNQLLVDREEIKELSFSLNEPPHFTTVYSPDNPNLIGVIIVGLEKNQTYPEKITVHRQIVIIDHDPGEVKNPEEFITALQEKKVGVFVLELDDKQDSPIEQVLINEGRTKVIILEGKITDWTPKWGPPKLPA